MLGGDNITKKILFLFLLSCFLILPNKIKAITYQETTQETFQYNINNFKIDYRMHS